MTNAEENNKLKALATFAGGCFWCMEPPFEKLDGVESVISGYIGGSKDDADYQSVSSGQTNHAEAVQITYDPTKTSYEELLNIFWRNIDPTQVNGQFADHGPQYRTGIFYHDDAQKAAAEESKKKLEDSKKFDKPIATEITSAGEFYPAEEYHQDYYKKNPTHYQMYSLGSGRKGYIKKTWGE